MSTVPDTRRIVVVGDDHALSLGEESTPQPAAGELLIRVHAAGINRPDLMQRYGLYPPPADASPVLGLEVAGDVVAVGDGVSEFKVGDAVMALCNGGGYADYTVAPASQCLAKPDNLSWAQAAALPEVLFTVWHNVFQRGGLKAGEYFLVHGGSSGIGTTAIALAAAKGAQVYTTAGSAEKCAACETLGAKRAVNYKHEDYVEVLKTASDGHGMDVILDMVGGDYVQRDIKLAAADGRIVFIAFQGGFKTEVNFTPVLMKRLVLTASTLRAQSAQQKASIAADLKREVLPLLADNSLLPVIDSTFDFSDVAAAHARMESGEHIGKIVLSLPQ
ncbi:NAD(P)H-quinone oxidoreductase [Spongiibacter nanhainus]|uniref:NAD(P)H-quinone oxidoreductase n=1 Tax=Spongiibacter nanhainus TaxID=2794344 RepID=A0A7T4R0K1_9GAMM|nr:NAD(P)H-quinone oxidoreductase [Spongiibacter nanhainus]QQD18211.1 NAD(P)H-quinone oxidoreductase [Spongiibacter nanhainus]